MLIVPPSPEHIAAWRAEYEEDTRFILKPRPRLRMSGWAEEFRHLGGTSAEKGPWRNRRVPQMVEIMDAVSDPLVEEITVMKPARAGVSESVILNTAGYYTHQDPSDIIIALPTLDDAETFSKKKLTPAFTSSPVLRDLLPLPRSRDGSNTILQKEVPGGSITLVGTNSPRMLRMRDARIVEADEVDAMEPTPEGDPLDLLRKRADNAPNRKLIWISSPSWKGRSRIEKKYAESDRRRYWMPCPRCGEPQVLMFGGKDKPFGLKWVSGRPETVVYICIKGCTIQERSKQEMHQGARWLPDRPEVLLHRGYWFNALISLFDGARWRRLVEQFLAGHEDPEKLQVFVNTVLAETYELRGETLEGDALFNRREVYAAEVPMGVGVLTAFVDVHDSWSEVLVRGWGKEQESWRILHVRIEGSPDDAELWDQVDGYLFATYRHESGADLRIRRTFIDSGDRADTVYAYVKPRQARGVFASKGDKAVMTAPIVIRAKKPNDAGVKLMTVGTFTAKRRLFARLKLKRVGAGYYHFHKLPPDADIATVAQFDAQDREFFKQFASEKLMPDKDARGRPILKYKQIADRNESVDLEGGNIAVLQSLGPGVYDRLEREAARVASRGAAAKTGGPPSDSGEVDPDEEPPAAPTQRNPFVFGF